MVTCFNLRGKSLRWAEHCKRSVFAVLIFYYSRDKAFGHAVIFFHWIDSCGAPFLLFLYIAEFFTRVTFKSSFPEASLGLIVRPSGAGASA